MIVTTDVRVDGVGGAVRVIVVAGGDDEVRLFGCERARTPALAASVCTPKSPITAKRVTASPAGIRFDRGRPLCARPRHRRGRRERRLGDARRLVRVRALLAARTLLQQGGARRARACGRTLRFHSWNPVCGPSSTSNARRLLRFAGTALVAGTSLLAARASADDATDTTLPADPAVQDAPAQATGHSGKKNKKNKKNSTNADNHVEQSEGAATEEDPLRGNRSLRSGRSRAPSSSATKRS